MAVVKKRMKRDVKVFLRTQRMTVPLAESVYSGSTDLVRAGGRGKLMR